MPLLRTYGEQDAPTNTTPKTMTDTIPTTTVTPPALPPQAPTTDMPPSSATIVPGVTPAKESIPPVLDTPVVTVKQEHPDPPVRRKRVLKPALSEGDFVLSKVHKIVCKDGDRKGKLVLKAEGPYMLQRFTDATRQVAIIADVMTEPGPREWQTSASGPEWRGKKKRRSMKTT